MNIYCCENYNLTRIPSTLDLLINTTVKTNQLLCSIDFSNTGINKITKETIGNINSIYSDLLRINSNHEKNIIKLSFSNIKHVQVFQLVNVNVVLYIHNSHVISVMPKSLQTSSSNLELNLVNSKLNQANWLNLLDSASLKLLTLRNIESLETNVGLSQFRNILPIAGINDLKVYNSVLPPAIDENFFLFKILAYIEQIELIGCTIERIKTNTFLKYNMAFINLRILILSNNKIRHIEEGTFKGLSNLAILDLDENPIEHIESNSFNHLTSLRTLSLNSNIKLIELLGKPGWLSFYLFNNTMTNLKEINLKNNGWLNDFCLIESFAKLNLNSASDFHINQNNSRLLRLFYDSDIADSVLNKSESIYCNKKFICHNRIYYSKTRWNMGIEKLCTTDTNNQNSCSFYHMSNKCEKQGVTQMVSSNQNINAINNLSTTKCLSPKIMFHNIRSIILLIVLFAVILIVFALGFFYFSYSRSKEIFDMEKKLCNDNAANHKLIINSNDIDQGREVFNKSDLVNGNDYYVFLLSANQIKR